MRRGLRCVLVTGLLWTTSSGAQSLPPQGEALSTGSTSGLEAVIPLSSLDPDAPVSIQAESLELVETEAGGRTLQFSDRVRVEQGDLKLRAARLEAIYPAGAKQPSRISARGSVRIQKGDREARCDRADYRRAARTIVCRGNASIRDGRDRISGERIVLDLGKERVTVSGATRVALEPRSGGSSEASDDRLARALEDGPIRIDAQNLQASQTSTGRRISFAGSVEIAQEELGLSADRIEARYPPERRGAGFDRRGGLGADPAGRAPRRVRARGVRPPRASGRLHRARPHVPSAATG